MATVEHLRDRMSDFELKTTDRLARIETQIIEIKELIKSRKRDWAGRAKLAATVLGSGGLGAIVVKIVEMVTG